MNKAILGK